MPADVLLDLSVLETTSRYRGIGRYAVELARAIAELGAGEREGLDVGALMGVLGPATSLEDALARIDRVEPSEEKATMDWIWQRRRDLPRTLRASRARLFHATQPLGTPRGSFVPRVTTCHDLLKHVLHEHYLPGRWAYRRGLWVADAARFHASKRTIAISRATADCLVRLLGVPASRIDVVPHGVSSNLFRVLEGDEADRARATREALGVRAPYLLYVGGADARKQVPLLIRAFDRARLRDHELVLAGSYSPIEAATVEAAIAEVGAKDRVRVLGYVSDEQVVALLAGARALAFASIGEGFGLPLLEAMACGCPVVAARAIGVEEVAGEDALVVAPNDVDAFAAAMREIANDDVLARELSRRGVAKAARYSWRDSALGTIASYRRALGG